MIDVTLGWMALAIGIGAGVTALVGPRRLRVEAWGLTVIALMVAACVWAAVHWS